MKEQVRPIIPQGLCSGNYLLLKGETLQIDSLDILVIKQSIDKGVDHNYRGIELTEQWLRNFHFVKNGFNQYEKILPNTASYIMLSLSGDYLFLREGKKPTHHPDDDVCIVWNKDLRKVFYVHELQNLYFNLTTEILTL